MSDETFHNPVIPVTQDARFNHWRLIQTEAAPGAWNMAVDEAILEAAGEHKVAPTLRLYAWSPPCLSLGFAQPVSDVDRAALHRFGWHLVRRPTGGRAILHTDELTYSVIAPLDHPLVLGGVLESYRRISQALLDALARLGLPAQADREYAIPQGKKTGEPVCFEVPSNYEVTVQGKKLIGSAQARKKDGVLQHGSLPLYGDLSRITRVLVYPDETCRSNAAQRLLAHAATIEMMQREVTWEEGARAFAAAFRNTLAIDLQAEELTSGELRRAAELVEQKYAHPSWTERV